MTKTLTGTVFAALFALGLLSACDQLRVDSDPRSASLDGETAAIVNDDPIYHADVELEAVAQGIIAPGDVFGPTHEQYQLILDQLIDQRLLAQEAMARNLDLDDSARHRLAIARERVLGNLLVESLVEKEVTDEAVRAMYSEQVRLQQLGDEVRISLITIADEATARTVISEFRAGTDFSALAFKYSTDAATRIEGGDLGYVGPAEQPEPFGSMIADTVVGAVSDPFESEGGWHVLKVEDRRQRAPKTLDQMRPDIISFLTFGEINKILRQLRSTAVIDTNEPVPAANDTETESVAEPVPTSETTNALANPPAETGPATEPETETETGDEPTE